MASSCTTIGKSKVKLSGSTSCNNFSGNFELKKSELKLNPGTIIHMACQGNGESLFPEAFNQVKLCKTEATKLTLPDGTEELMTLVPKK
jgi:heat shock protein HslJ